MFSSNICILDYVFKSLEIVGACDMFDNLW